MSARPPSDPSRRRFLATGAAAAAAAFVRPGSWLQDPAAAAVKDDRVLVMLQLSGGNDVLSMLVPHADDAYGRARKASRIASSEVLRIDERIGLHPALGGIRALLDRGAFAAVLGTGYPQPNFSHFASLDIWHAADAHPGRAATGWIGRFCDQAFAGDGVAERAVAIGGSGLPLALVGTRCRGVGVGSPETFRFQGDRGDARLGAAYRKLQTARPDGDGPLAHVARTAMTANACSDRIRSAIAGYRPGAEYPPSALGRSFAHAAALVARRPEVRVLWLAHGGYDTHAGQRARHDRLMAELDAAVSAFQQDLAQQGSADRVLTVAFSEFGRRVAENGSAGTDHGAGGAMLLFGPRVRPGLHGAMPSLTDLQGGGGGSLKHTVDFRQVYAAVLERWLRTPSKPLLGGDFAPVDCIAG
jgi:uncharacterized protein (DUF1501 family)